MSTATLYLVPNKGKIKPYLEFQNAWRGVPAIRSALTQKYLCWSPIQWAFEPNGMRELSTCDLKVFEGVMLLLTADKCMVLKKDLPKLINAIKQFEEEYRLPTLYGESIPILEELMAEKKCHAICWNHTSVYSCQWYSGNKLWDISRDKGHWFLEFD